MRSFKWFLVAVAVFLSFFAGRWSVMMHHDPTVRTADNGPHEIAVSRDQEEHGDSLNLALPVLMLSDDEGGVRLINRPAPPPSTIAPIEKGMKIDELERKSRLQKTLDGGDQRDPDALPKQRPFLKDAEH